MPTPFLPIAAPPLLGRRRLREMCAPAPAGTGAHHGPTSLSTPKNRLLAALPEEEQERFLSNLHPVSLALRQVLYEASAPIKDRPGGTDEPKGYPRFP